MYHYLKIAYEQWCSGQDYSELLEREEAFLTLVHNMMGYDIEIAREFLMKQSWYVSKNKLPCNKT